MKMSLASHPETYLGVHFFKISSCRQAADNIPAHLFHHHTALPRKGKINNERDGEKERWHWGGRPPASDLFFTRAAHRIMGLPGLAAGIQTWGILNMNTETGALRADNDNTRFRGGMRAVHWPAKEDPAAALAVLQEIPRHHRPNAYRRRAGLS
ncbi:hypothetical protein NKH60_02510 [Mesorhizobium sp. M1006]|uniref:hypothetical protein n=1 Tax=Mesorhizobium sp. M1006 TaxID=2957048 RepID=UPI00333E0349